MDNIPLSVCASTNCRNKTSHGKMFCEVCSHTLNAMSISNPVPVKEASVNEGPGRRGNDTPMSTRYPKYYKPVPSGMNELDIYAICMMFNVNDAALSHALKKIMLPGERTGGKTRRDDIKEARDTLTRWLDLH